VDNNKKHKKNIMTNIWFLVRRVWKWDKTLFFYLGLFTIALAVVPFIDMFAPKFLIEELMGGKRTEVLFSIVLGYFIVSAIMNYLSTYSEGIFSPSLIGIGFNFNNLIYEKCMEMDFKYTEDPKILNDIETSKRAVSSIEGVFRKLFKVFATCFAFLGYSAIVFTLNPWVLLYLIVNVFIIYYLTIRAKEYEYGKKDNISELNRKGKYINNLMHNFAYGKDIRIFSLSKWIADKFKVIKNEEVEIQRDIKYKYFKISIADVFLLLIREGIAYAYLIYRVLYDGMSIGNFTLYFATIAGFAAWMQKLLEDLAYINAQNLYISDFRNFLDSNLKIEKSNYIDIPQANTYEIEFKNVSFKYPGSERYIYKNLSLRIKKGQRVAIVGVNGAGKTTFVKLLTRLYEPTEGQILLNGVDISTFNKKEYYKLFSVVFQEIKVFAFSIAENIALNSKEKIDRKKVLKSIQKSGIGEKINSLEKGIDTPLLKILDSSGIELSGGENQRLALARGLYKDGAVIVLDEPTAALDPIAEYNIYKGFDSMIGDKTAVYISHRLASTRFCDVIAFFEDGEIKEYGTHDELLSKNGRYAEMFNVQASYYKEENLESEGA